MKEKLTQAGRGSLPNRRKMLCSPAHSNCSRERRESTQRAAQRPANPSEAAGRAGSDASRKAQTPSKFSF